MGELSRYDFARVIDRLLTATTPGNREALDEDTIGRLFDVFDLSAEGSVDWYVLISGVLSLVCASVGDTLRTTMDLFASKAPHTQQGRAPRADVLHWWRAIAPPALDDSAIRTITLI